MGTFDLMHLRVLLTAIVAVAGSLLLVVTLDAGQDKARRAAAQDTRPAAMAAASSQLVAARTARVEAAPVEPEAAVPVAPSTPPEDFTVDAPANRAGTSDRPDGELTMQPTRDLQIRSRPGGGSIVGTLPARSNYLDTPMRVWVLARSADGAYGRVTVPWSGASTTGWVPLAGATLARTNVAVRISLSRREVLVLRDGTPVARLRATTGAAASPTPTGLTYVTDRVAVPASQPQFGTYAFGLSMIQPRLPAGWTGGNQMAIHGTNDPASLGAAVSAGCLRVSETGLDQLRPLLRLGTPVVIEA